LYKKNTINNSSFQTADFLQKKSNPKPRLFSFKRGEREGNYILIYFIVFDANGKPGYGMLRGNRLLLGDYEECMSFPADSSQNITGQYCLVNIDFKVMEDLPMDKYFGLDFKQ